MLSVRYSKALAILEIVVGILLIISGLLTGNMIQLFPGVVLGTLGVLMLVNPMFVVKDGEAQVRSPLGFTVRRHPVSGPADLRIEGKRLVHVPTGKKIISVGFGVDKKDVAQLQASLPSAAPQG